MSSYGGFTGEWRDRDALYLNTPFETYRNHLLKNNKLFEEEKLVALLQKLVRNFLPIYYLG